MRSNIWKAEEIELHETAYYYLMDIWVRYDCSEDNYFSNLMHWLDEIHKRAEHLFMKKLGLERYNRIIDHNKGHGPVKVLFTTSDNEINVRVKLEHCGCGKENERTERKINR